MWSLWCNRQSALGDSSALRSGCGDLSVVMEHRWFWSFSFGDTLLVLGFSFFENLQKVVQSAGAFTLFFLERIAQRRSSLQC